jgi:hypothetical protein
MAPTLKGPLTRVNESEWVKSTENLDDSPFRGNLSIDNTFSQRNLAGQSLKLHKRASKYDKY